MPTRLAGASASQISHFICLSENGESGSINFKSRFCLFLSNHIDLLQCSAKFLSVQYSHSVLSYSLWPHGLQHARLPCPSPILRACSNSWPSSGWCHPTIPSSCPLLLLPSVFLSVRGFSNKVALRIRWPKYWSFSFSTSPSNEHSGLISFKIDWFDLLAVQGTLKSLLQHHSSKASVL